MTPFAQHPAVKWLPSVCPESAGRLLCACPALDSFMETHKPLFLGELVLI